jgi:ribosomal protein S18 acetylase RimI-like enzyme
LKQITVEAFDGLSIDQGMQQTFGRINGRDWQWRKARHLDEDAQREPSGIFVAEADGAVIGYITTWQDREAGIGHIPNIAFAPAYRGRGLGRALIRHALEHFRQSGLSHAKIETLVQNDVGNHLYQSIGFREVARQVHFLADIDEALSNESDRG